ncbi:low molecular mass early light-inducible protein HV90, chloroplastic [Physcomitrium patens]|uniref:Uncharacterized protein n=1 Tax=Physcomitrium patens TaxID=3218 RepID=A0A2K1K3G2_PHYPA|nr:high molecular mass early light-inducible protein HV58, chloroplastic-like [Physcomitrium patens]PNR48311.1 hypothetical protein PHYPA_012787 [Physcomitrium patens]|eukprot:XP_024384103.1 high molecular mass early light-inducible protein HV58, chloroplastic-like [Physcomitrella patens]
MAAVVSQVGAGTGAMLGGINLPCRVAGVSQAARLVNSPRLLTRRAGRVRCEVDEEGPKAPIPTSTPGVAGSFDRATKKTITKEEVLQNQATNESEQRSIFGAKPTPGSVYGRPEVERRPETGDLSPWSVFAFDGAAPETINGRLAMLGFVWALVGENATGLSVIDQVFSPGSTGLIWFLASVQIFTYASLVPIFNAKESTDARSFGPFTAKAERWNGRAAMIGFFSLIVTELFLQGPILKLFANSVVPPV